MIPAAAIKAYHKRVLDSHLWVKQLTRKQLDAALAKLDPPALLNPKARIHQKACFLLGVSYPQFCFWLSMGTGKTLLALELLRYWFEAGVIRRALIFTISDKAYSPWTTQLRRYGFDLPMTSLTGSSKNKWAQLEEFGDGLVLLSYPGARAMVSKRAKVKKKKKKMKLKLDPAKMQKLLAWANAIVLDESTECGNPRSLNFQMISGLRKGAKVRYALAGRPFGRDPTPLWAQNFLIDDGETLGETLGLFRGAYFTEEDSEYGGPYSKTYTFKSKLRPQLAQTIQHRSITYAAEECIDVPKVTRIIEEVSFSEEAEAYYQKVVEQVIAARGNLRVVKNAFLRMRQISSGFVGFKDDESGEKAEVEFAENPKLERQLELLEGVPYGRGSVLFYEFTISGKLLVKELQAKGYEPIWLWSGTKNADKELAKFAKAEQPIAVVQNRVGSFSLDGLQHTANYEFFYESPVSGLTREQAEARLIRDGQKWKVFVYDLVTRGTVDYKILDFHRQGQSLVSALMREPSKLLRA